MLKTEIPSLALACLVLSFSTAYAQETFTIDVPDSTFTRVIGLNAQGDICGGTQVNGVRLAFTASRRVNFTDLETFAYPGAVFTQCRGINAAGQMVGVYQTPDLRSHAFVKDGSEFISFDVPGATDTRGFGIDPRGQIVGRYTTPDGVVHGFLWRRKYQSHREDDTATEHDRAAEHSKKVDGAVFTIDAPRATATEASGITPQGAITGVYQTADGKFHGYILSNHGFQTIDVPDALHTGAATGGMWMSASGELAGFYVPKDGPPGNRAWVRHRNGTFHTYLFPGAVDTCFFNINERGDLVGRYIADGVEHGLYIDRRGRRGPDR